MNPGSKVNTPRSLVRWAMFKTSGPMVPGTASSNAVLPVVRSFSSYCLFIRVSLVGRLVELFLFGAARQRRDRRRSGDDGLGHVVEVAGTDLALMACGRIAALLGLELRLLQRDIGRH